MKVRISDDAVSLACGADAVAAAFEAAGCEVERVSSWGMHWLEPLVEIDGIGYGPVGVGDVEGLIEPSLRLRGEGQTARSDVRERGSLLPHQTPTLPGAPRLSQLAGRLAPGNPPSGAPEGEGLIPPRLHRKTAGGDANHRR